ncbi:MAG: NnrS family protein, partial [Limisphaerales bacterium]
MNPSRISMRELAAEPFRLFFPLAVLVGLAGVSLWPLHFGGVMKLYPGLSHARLMAYGLFGGFIFGFLGTAMPRMLSVRPFTVLEAFLLVLVYLAMAGAYFFAKIPLGDELFLAVLLCF